MDNSAPDAGLTIAQRLQMLAQYGGPEKFDPRMRPMGDLGYNPETYYNTVARPGGTRKLMAPQDAVDADPSRNPPFHVAR